MGAPPAGLRHPRVPTGQLMSVQSVCLGWHWYPYAYTRTADDTDGAPVKPMPVSVDTLARRAVAVAYGADSPEAARFEPDAAIVNLYPPGARLGLHQDGEEPSDAPVVTISLGDTCTFRLAGVDRRTGPFVDVDMRSGDLLVFGRENRRIFHGVPKVFSGTAPTGSVSPTAASASPCANQDSRDAAYDTTAATVCGSNPMTGTRLQLGFRG